MISRVKVPRDKVAWHVPYPEYAPPTFTHKTVLAQPVWADPEDFLKVTRTLKSYEGEILYDKTSHLPLNPRGRTGLQGRGLLGKWGPNFAVDALITCKQKFLAIKRKDTNLWALPGGMVEEGEDLVTAIGRELYEETGVTLNMSDAKVLYCGYVNDPRNTDNAWIETVVFHKNVEDTLHLHAGSDAKAANWLTATDNLYANHRDFVNFAITG